MQEPVYVVIRAAGERTEALCSEIARAQIGDDQVAVLHERPFFVALKQGIEIALHRKARWTIFLDADILLRPLAIQQMIEKAESTPGRFYMLNFRVLDRGFLGPAYGVHLYPTHMFDVARRYLQQAREDQRPETRLCKEMARTSVPTVFAEQLVGLHGYEQFHRDLYRTTFVRTVKFKRGIPYMLKVYRRHYGTHDDFKSMLWGLIDGIAYRTDHSYAPLDSEVYRESAREALQTAGLHEKAPIDDSTTLSTLESLASSNAPDEDYVANSSWICPPQAGYNQVRRKSLRVALRSLGRPLRSLLSEARCRMRRWPV